MAIAVRKTIGGNLANLWFYYLYVLSITAIMQEQANVSVFQRAFVSEGFLDISFLLHISSDLLDQNKLGV